MRDWLGMIRRGIRKPPRVILARITAELRAEFERFNAPIRRRLRLSSLATELGFKDSAGLWGDLAQRPYPALTRGPDTAAFDRFCKGSRERILDNAKMAVGHRVDLLGSGPVGLGKRIDWSRDFKSGFDWPKRYFRDIEYNNSDRPSDVKVPWELSRMQWLIPVGQAYLITGEEHYAEAVKLVLEQWIEDNPYAGSVNWACTMEVAMRVFTWTWFFHVFNHAHAWQDSAFQEKFLCTLYLHVEFTERHIECSDVNGNHFTADAAALVFGGLFFGKGRNPERWQQNGWAFLEKEIAKQVYSDGVDFEASLPYHRLVMELFLLPALYRLKIGLPVEGLYQNRLLAMGRFVAAYSKPGGTAPYWGDADDARTLPFGGQNINDHRYLIGVAGIGLESSELLNVFSGPREEVFWIFGKEGCSILPESFTPPASSAFYEGGFYVMRGDNDHIFIDCGPIGLAGRGGHGHNDCLSFEAVLNGESLISDCGAYLYTASYFERNAFRSTSYHNTPQVDGEEINRFIRPDYLWNLHYDAEPSLCQWRDQGEYVFFRGEHRGYQRLSSPVVPRRTILLDPVGHALYINDNLIGEGTHDIRIPLHLSPNVDATRVGSDEILLEAGKRKFMLWWSTDSGYDIEIESARVSPSYGVVLPTKRIIWSRCAARLQSLSVFIAPEDSGKGFESQVSSWLSMVVD